MEIYNIVKPALIKAIDDRQTVTIKEIKKIIEALKPLSEEPKILERVLFFLSVYDENGKIRKKLSPRQRQVLNLIGLGYKTANIADLLDISPETVSTHRKNISKKLSISGSGQLQQYAYDYINSKKE